MYKVAVELQGRGMLWLTRVDGLSHLKAPVHYRLTIREARDLALELLNKAKAAELPEEERTSEAESS